MKHKFKYLTLGLILSLGAGFASCGSDDDEVVDPYASIYDKDKDKDKENGSETDPEKQKAEEEKAAQEAEKQRQQQEERAKQRAADSISEAKADTISLEALPRRSRIVGELHVDGRYLKDEQGNIVNLHGIAQTYSPWFNRVNDQYLWNNYDVDGCLQVNQSKLQKIYDHGWAIDFVRLHMDPHWTKVNAPWGSGENESHLYYSEENFRKYLDEVFVPMAEFMQNLGMRVLMRPPGVCPEVIALDDDYYKYMINVWTIVAQHPKLKNNPMIMFELANEPVKFRASDGREGASGGKIDEELSQYFQGIVDAIRAEGCNNILWVPGTSWQQDYRAYQKYPIKGDNIGYAVHCYPGWYGSDCYQQTGEIAPDMWRGSAGGYKGFKKDWDNSITNVVADKNPIIVTEMDWCSQKFKGRTWGSSITGTAGGKGFGANFKRIMDETGNVSWLTFVWDHDLSNYDPARKPSVKNFLYDPESGCMPVYRWFYQYWKDAE